LGERKTLIRRQQNGTLSEVVNGLNHALSVNDSGFRVEAYFPPVPCRTNAKTRS
jgi:hypothetical protein